MDLRQALQRPNAMRVTKSIRRDSERAFYHRNHFLIVDSSAPGTTLPLLVAWIKDIAPEIRIKMKTLFIVSNYANVVDFYEEHLADCDARVVRSKDKDIPRSDQFEGYHGVYRLTLRK